MQIEDKKFHFIAAGGVGMSALAKYLIERGFEVSGSDIAESKYTHLLESIGAKIYIGHNADLIKNDMLIVASSAVKENNPELKRAKELNLKIYHRSDILKILSDEFSNNQKSYFIGFSGTHGKTTTSGLASYVLEKAGYKPSFIVGGIIPDINTNAKYNDNKYFIAELDESDATIQKYATDIAVINNMEEDHLDCYVNGFIDIAKTFNHYLSNNPSQKVIINLQNEGTKKFMELYPDYNYITFGFDNATYTAKNIEIKGFTSQFNVYKNNSILAKIQLTIPGKHNIYNALAVCAALNEIGVDINKISEHFKSFTGMGRRFQKVGNLNDIIIYDDYAHHPSEIKTTLESAKTALSRDKRLVAVFQPHRYSRFQSLWSDFKNAFEYADMLFVTDVYAAGERTIDGISSETFVSEMNKSNVKYIGGNIEQAAEKILKYLHSGDIVITLGAGNITDLGKYLLQMRVNNG